jgi:lipid-binding SYLF domain-containing protein
MTRPGEAIPRALLEKVEAIAVFTDVKRVGFLIEGLSYGHGVVSRRLAGGVWSAPAYFILRGYSIGPQLKAESINIVMLFMNEKAANWLLDNKGVVFDRAKAPVAGPVGEIRTEQREVVPVADVFSYTFDDHRLVGQDLKNLLKNFALTPDNDMNKSAYRLKASELLSSAGIPATTQVPAEVNVFPQTLARYAVRP